MKRDYDFKNKVESILFSSGKKVHFDEIMNLIRIRDRQGVSDALAQLQKDYDTRAGALMIIQEGDFWKMTVREKYLSIVQRIVADTELSKTVMETLAVIAWKQPILQSEVIAIRTNKAYDHIAALEEMGFLTTEKHGRSKLIKLSEKFYSYFDVHDSKGLSKLFKDVNVEGQNQELSDEQKLELELKEATSNQPLDERPVELEQAAKDIEAQAQLMGMSIEAQKLEQAEKSITEKDEEQNDESKEILEELEKIAKK